MKNMENRSIWQVANIHDSNNEMLLDMSDCQELCFFLEKFNWPKYDIVSHDNIDPDEPRNFPGIIFHELTQEMYDYWLNEEYGYVVHLSNNHPSLEEYGYTPRTDSKLIRSFRLHQEVKDTVIPLQTIWENASNIRN